MEINHLFEDLSKLEGVEAIAIGGSRASSYADNHSDYDVYVYYTLPLAKEERKQILEKYCSRIELNNQYWEQEDNCVLMDGTPIDLVYRKFEDFMGGIYRVVQDCQPSNGYTTCLWHNLIHSKIVFDRHARLKEAQKLYNIDYPEELRRNIIVRNMRLLSGALPSYDDQIKKAIQRKDFNSINHRTTEFLSSYFDVIFALNRKTHPGEKRLIQICLKECRILPKDFEKNLNTLFRVMFQDLRTFKEILNEIIQNIEKIVNESI